nr:YlcI/YnfO family protein [Pantoea stewartii]
MATGRRNNKSLQVSVRLPLADLELIEGVKEPDESTAGFLIAAAKNEIKRRQRKKTKDTSQE